VSHHVFDMSERAPHQRVAAQLRDLAGQIERGEIELAYEELHGPTHVNDPVDVTVDLSRRHHHMELEIRLSWPATPGER
jgi:amphi-Trp domain-containing protein